MPSIAATTTDNIPIVLYWRARYASAPCWMALEIFCISGVPRPRDSTQRARKMAKIRASALAPMTTVNRDDCVCVMLRGRVCACEGRRASTHDGGGALDAAPEIEHGNPDQHQHEPGDRLGARGGRQEEQHHHPAAEEDVQRGQHGIAGGPIRPREVRTLAAQHEQ